VYIHVFTARIYTASYFCIYYYYICHCPVDPYTYMYIYAQFTIYPSVPDLCICAQGARGTGPLAYHILYYRYLYNIFRFSFINLKAKYDLPIICRYTLCGCSFEIWIIYYICFFVHERFTKYNMWCVIFC